MGVCKTMFYIWIKQESNYQKKRSARWKVLCGKEECTKDNDEAQNANNELNARQL
jgi:hypothetical protein